MGGDEGETKHDTLDVLKIDKGLLVGISKCITTQVRNVWASTNVYHIQNSVLTFHTLLHAEVCNLKK